MSDSTSAKKSQQDNSSSSKGRGRVEAPKVHQHTFDAVTNPQSASASFRGEDETSSLLTSLASELLGGESSSLLQRRPSTPNADNGAPVPSFTGWNFSHISAQAKRQPPLQAKLMVGPANDQYEQEADRMAEQVMSMPTAVHAPNEGGQGSLQRQEEDELAQMKPQLIQRDSAAGFATDDTFERNLNNQRSSGSPLSDALRADFEPKFGADFSGVRVHTNEQSHQLNHAIQAKAFTTGQDIFFSQGAYEPASRAGQELIAHELTHVVQQNAGMVNRMTAQGDQDRQSPGADILSMSGEGPAIQAKTKEEIARHGSFDINGAKYKLLEGEGCEISIQFKLGTGIPSGTKISFIQAIRTITIHGDSSVTSAQKVGGQEPAKGFERLDQFKGNPSAYYLDYIDEKLVQLINLAAMPEQPYDIRDYNKYSEYSMEPVSKADFTNFWDKFDKGRLQDLITVQTETSSDTEKMSEGKKLDAASLFNLFNLFSSDVNAQIYDMPKDNLKVPTEIGDISRCLFHTAAVTKVASGDATVWDIVQWGYEIKMMGEQNYKWKLIPLQTVAFDEAMLGPALEKMKATTKDYIGPDRLVQPV